jgi:hypothetical protein
MFLLFFCLSSYPDTRNSVIQEIEQHVSESVRTEFREMQTITRAHELTHMLLHQVRKPGKQAVYLSGRIIYVDIPAFKLEDVQQYVPESLQHDRFKTYVVKQSKSRWENVSGSTIFVSSHNNNPLYLLDEMNAYIVGANAGLEDAKNGFLTMYKDDRMVAPLEMSVYVLALCMAAKNKDPKYWQSNATFRLVARQEIEMAWKIYEIGKKHEHLKWNTKIPALLHSSELRPIIDELKLTPPKE